MTVRMGIDVGGTFTDAVILDNDTFELIGTVKIPTTHDAENGVAEGIVMALHAALEQHDIKPEDVVFIAHGTTQATNALLEGDVEKVGVIGLGKGVEGVKVRQDTQIGNIELAKDKYLYTKHYFMPEENWTDEDLSACMEDMRANGINVAVVSAAYSVDDPTSEQTVKERLDENGFAVPCGHDISKLHGLRIRTRTAVINSSILPKMIQTAAMTEKSVAQSGIKAPLMIMRCDGGVMAVQEVRTRPILTMLSGPAAGVAGALMYEKVSEGIFLEVGGTSTDISAVHNGQVMISYAEVGGHKTYVNSLDVRTVGVAGGSMIRVNGKNVVDVGPRSAHIAGLPYLVYAKPEEIGELEVRLISPTKGDYGDYVSVYDRTHDKAYALTLSGCANASGYIPEGAYAAGYPESARKGFDTLAAFMGIGTEELLKKVNDRAAEKNAAVVKSLIKDYQLDADQLVLVGGGGGSAAVVPYLAEYLGMSFRIARNAECISPIGVALALVRETVERTIPNPTDADILMVRKEAEQLAIKSGASAETLDVFVEVDGKNNIVRAIASGATELKTKNRIQVRATDEEILEIAGESMKGEKVESVSIAARTDDFCIVKGNVTVKRLFGLIKDRRNPMRIVTKEGVIRIQCRNGKAVSTTAAKAASVAREMLQEYTTYSDGGEKYPRMYVVVGARLVDCSKLVSIEQMISLIQVEMAGIGKEDPVLMLFEIPEG